MNEAAPTTPQRTALEGGTLKAPFPAFGGKSRIAAKVWEGLGPDVRNYVEPFCFSSAMLLRRPGGPGPVETINDRNAFVANFWRAVRADPEAVAVYADWPVNEVDLHARHRWLVTSDEAHARLEAVRRNPEAFDAKIAGWWCWGACCWIGSGWCDETTTRWSTTESMHVDLYWSKGVHIDETRPDMSDVGRGVHAKLSEQMPHMDAAGRLVQSPPADVTEQVPRLTTPTGQGVKSGEFAEQGNTRQKRPRAHTNETGWMPGVLGPAERQPAIGQGGWGINVAEGTCEQRRRWVLAWMLRLANRLRAVRVCCGHWARVCDSPSTMSRLGLTGVFLDPPYRISLADGSANRTRHIYANDRHQDVNALCDEVQAWALRWAPYPLVRIALCGLEGEYPEIEKTVGKPGGWRVIEWKSTGGYGNRKGGDVNENRHRERVWLSPGCVRQGNVGLFG